jgi:FAD/FMN-containing dehydrogenase
LNRSTLGGGIGNNSTGAHSVRYGITDAYTDELKVILSDGSIIHTREIILDSEEYEEIVSKDDRGAHIYETVRGLVEEHHEQIEKKYPNLKRSVSGYNPNRVIYENDDSQQVINLSKLLVGAEGTLGVIIEATLDPVTVPDETALGLYFFDDLAETMETVPEALGFPVSAVELMDDEVFRLARESDGYANYAEAISEDAKAALMLEWDDKLVDDFEAAIADTTEHFVENGDAFDVLEAYTEDVADLVVEHHGVFSGEHGEGMARTEFNPKMYGDDLWGAFKQVKTAFDPDWRMNPGNVVYREGPEDPGPDSNRGVDADMRENHQLPECEQPLRTAHRPGCARRDAPARVQCRPQRPSAPCSRRFSAGCLR